jgi:hypothetical protein
MSSGKKQVGKNNRKEFEIPFISGVHWTHDDLKESNIKEITFELGTVAKKLNVSRNQLRLLLNSHGFVIENKLKAKLSYTHLEFIANDYIKSLRKTLKKYYSIPDQPKKKGLAEFFRIMFCDDVENDNLLTYLSPRGHVGKIDLEKIRQEFIDSLVFGQPKKIKSDYFIYRLKKFAFKIYFSFHNVRDFVRHEISPRLFHVFIDEEDSKRVYASLSYSFSDTHSRVACLNNFKTSLQNEKYRYINR